jgi:hypothetical protein
LKKGYEVSKHIIGVGFPTNRPRIKIIV